MFRKTIQRLRGKNNRPQPPPPPPLHGRISVPLKKDALNYWYIEVPALHASHEFKFEIDTYGICSWVPDGINFFEVGPPELHIDCPWRPFIPRPVPPRPSFSGRARRSQMTIGAVTWEGHLITERREHSHGFLGWTLSDSRVPEWMHFLPGFLSKFESPIFAMYLTGQADEAKLDIGGVDGTFNIKYYKVVKTEGHQPWLIGSASIFVGETRIETSTGTEANNETAFVSTIPYLKGPPSEVTEIQAKIRAESTKNRVVYFQWENREKWQLKPDSSHSGSNDYWGSYENLIIPGPPEMTRWEVGIQFWNDRYMVFKAGPEPELGIGERPPSYERPASRESFVYPPPVYPPSPPPPPPPPLPPQPQHGD